jgi:hypothetical protein
MAEVTEPGISTRRAAADAPMSAFRSRRSDGRGRLRCDEQTEHERKEPDQPGPQQTHVVPYRGEDNVGGVALYAMQEVAAEMAIALHVADDGLDGIAAAPLAAVGGREATFLAGRGREVASILSPGLVKEVFDSGLLLRPHLGTAFQRLPKSIRPNSPSPRAEIRDMEARQIMPVRSPSASPRSSRDPCVGTLRKPARLGRVDGFRGVEPEPDSTAG